MMAGVAVKMGCAEWKTMWNVSFIPSGAKKIPSLEERNVEPRLGFFNFTDETLFLQNPL